jgi:hypothetical protein
METENKPGPPPLPQNVNKYEILGVNRDATDDDLRVAWRRLALLYHPDRHPEEEREQASQIFRCIASAWETLSDPAERRRYDIALSRNESFREKSGGAHEVSLADILAGIDEYEHIFSESSVSAIAHNLDEIVGKSLIGELGEQVVDAWPLPSAPGGAKHRGYFQAGALVLTNIRVLLPYTFTWQETHGNTRTTYTGAAMPVLPLPLLQRIVVVAEKRVKQKSFVDFQHTEGTIRIRPRKTNLTKLLLVAQLWGVPVEARQEDARLAELLWALLRPWQWCAGLFFAVTISAAVLGIFGDGTVDNVADLFDFFRRTGIWQWSVVLTAVISGWRLWRWTFAYTVIDLSETLRPPAGKAPTAAATLSTTAVASGS